MMKEIVQQVKNNFHDRLCAIRHPDTGEFPTVIIKGDSLDNLSAKNEGSPDLLNFVKTRISQDPELEDLQELFTTAKNSVPKVFLSFAYEDQALAEKVAFFLMENCIDTWWSEWCIRSGDSFRQKIDEGLNECTHFIVLLTPTSIQKPWVNQEMDAGLVKKLNTQCKFIAVRYNLPAYNLPPLLSGQHSPEIKDETFQKSMTRLVNDIHGVTRKPALGPGPTVVKEAAELRTGYSAAASAIAKIFVDKSEHADGWDTQIDSVELCNITQMPEDDITDALYELSSDLIEEEFGTVRAKEELYEVFDKFWKEWDPESDALRIATDMINDPTFPTDTQEIAQLYNWRPRRLNPALTYLLVRKLVKDLKTLGNGYWVISYVEKTDATRRFVKSRHL